MRRFVELLVVISLPALFGCSCRQPMFGSPYSQTYAPQYYAQPVQQPAPMMQPAPVMQPQMMYAPQQACQPCPQTCPQVCQPCY